MDRIVFGTKSIPVLIAQTEAEQAYGLMGQKWPPPVMAFPFDKPDIYKFWMRDTPSPLDIVWARNGKVINIEAGVPFSEQNIGPDELSDLAIEMPRGEAQKLAIRAGTNVRLVYGLISFARKIELKLKTNNFH